MTNDNTNKKYSSNFDDFIRGLARQIAYKRVGISPEDPDAYEQLKVKTSTKGEMTDDFVAAEKAADKIRKILVIDDDFTVREVVKASLETALDDAFINTAEGGKEGWALIHEHADTYDILVCDVEMPDLSGIELIKMMREQNYRIPVLLLTGHAKHQPTVEALNAVSKDIDYMLKPFEAEDLVNTVELILSKKAKRSVRATRALLDPLAEIGHDSSFGAIPSNLAKAYFRDSLADAEKDLDIRQKTLLVVDRDSRLMESMRSFFRNLGYKVITRKYPEKALDLISNGGEHVDLVISGYYQKDDYAALYEAVADQNELPPIPLFLLSTQLDGLAGISPPPRTFLKGTRPGDLKDAVELEIASYRQKIAERVAVKDTVRKANEYAKNRAVIGREQRLRARERLNNVLIVTPDERREEELSSSLKKKGFNILTADAETYESILHQENPPFVIVSEAVGEDAVRKIHSFDRNALVVWNYKQKPDPDQWQKIMETGRTLFPYDLNNLVEILERERSAKREEEVNPTEPDDISMEHIQSITDNLAAKDITGSDILQAEIGGVAGYAMSFFGSQLRKREEGLRYRGRFQNDVWEGRFLNYILKATEPEHHDRLQRELEAIKVIHSINKEKGGPEPFIKVVNPRFPFVLRSRIGSLLLTDNEGEDVAKEMHQLFSENTLGSKQKLLRIYDDIIEQEARLLASSYRFPEELIDVTHLPDMKTRREYYWNRIVHKVIGTGEDPFIGSIRRVLGGQFADELMEVFSKNYGPILDIITSAREGFDTDRTPFNITRKIKNSNGSSRVCNIDFGNLRNAPDQFGSPLNIGPYPYVVIPVEESVGFDSREVFSPGAREVTIKDRKIVDSARRFNYHLQHTDDPYRDERMIKNIYCHMMKSYSIGVQRSLTMFANFMAWLPKDNAMNLWYGKSQIDGAINDIEKAASVAVTMEFMKEEDILPYTLRISAALTAVSRKLDEATPRLLNLS